MKMPSMRSNGAWARRFLAGGLSLTATTTLIQACTSEKVTGVDIGAISVSPSSSTVMEGYAVQFEALVRDQGGEALGSAPAVWVSDDESIATVSPEGVATGIRPGDVAIRASFEGAEGSAILTVEPGPDIDISDKAVALYAGAGGAAPGAVELEVTNEGGGDLGPLSMDVAYADGDADGWLGAELEGSQVPTRLTLEAAPDGLPAGIYQAVVTLSTPDPDGIPAPVTVTLSLAAIAVSDDEIQVNEADGRDSVTVVLATPPASDVVLVVESDDEDEVVVGTESLTFTPSDWDEPQTVVLTGVADSEVDGDQTTEVRFTVDADASDEAYRPALARTVRVTTLEGDESGFSVSETGDGTTVSEGGGDDTFSVVLRTRPESDVVITTTASDTSEATASPGTLTFGPADWDVPKTVTVSGVDDALVDGSQESTVRLQVDEGRSAATYHGLDDQTVTVTTEDDDGASLVVVESGDGTTVSESGTTDGFTVALGAQPAGDVVIDVTSGDPSEATASPPTLTFTSGSWSTPQTVTMTGVDDDAVDGSQETEVVLGVNPAASDDAFDDAADATVTVTTTDDDALAFTVTTGAAVSVDEGGTAEIGVVLDAEPATDVTITATSVDPPMATLDPESVTFTPATWDTPRTLTVTGVDNDVTDGARFTSVVLSVAGSAGDGLPDQTVSVAVADDDAAGFTLSGTSDLTVTEEAGTATFTVVLTAAPTGSVTLGVSSADPGEVTVAPSTLTFGPDDWATPQTVTLTGVADGAVDGDQATTVTVAVDAGASEAPFDDLPPQQLTVTTTDGDSATPPVTTVDLDPGS